MQRNYPEKLINSTFSEAKQKSRKELINQSRRKAKEDGKVRLIFTHNAGNPPLHTWLREAKKCLIKNEKAKNIGEKIQICYKQPKNLKRIVGQSKASKKKITDTDPGCLKCGRCRVSCPILKEGGSFQSTNTKKTYTIRQKMTCDTPFVVYLGTCKGCGG